MDRQSNLNEAKKQKNDEMYTRLEDIEAEIGNHQDYIRNFRGKTVFCNCDDPETSNFFLFFRKHFHEYGIRKLITTHYSQSGLSSYKLEWDGEMLNDDTINMTKTVLNGDGDFRSPECIELLKRADIVVTNPPFSLFREYINTLEEYNKDFIVIGNPNSITYKDFFPLLMQDKVRIGYKAMGTDMLFGVSDKYEQELRRNKVEGSGYRIVDGRLYARAAAIWFTNLDIDLRHKPLSLSKSYRENESYYPRYDNYDAINVNKVNDIPYDYYGVIGVPITFMCKYCPEQFEIIGATESEGKGFSNGLWDKESGVAQPLVNGKQLYKRLFIQRKMGT